MDYQGLQRLSKEQERALSNTETQLQKWEKFKDDYISLQTKIKDLPNQVSHDYMVPFGPLAFMPGKLIHTNEIMVLLGDNWFAEMSAKQSCEVIDRRLANINKSMAELEQQKELLKSRTDFTKHQLSTDEVDITEEYDSDEDKKWRESHKESVRKQKGLAKAGACNTDDDVLNKLEMLQLQEMRDREMHVSDEDLKKVDSSNTKQTEQPTHEADQHAAKAVRWGSNDVAEIGLALEQLSGSTNSSTSESSMDSDDSIGTGCVIHFKHSPRNDTQVNAPRDISESDIQSPSDIYGLYAKPRTKSILKQERSFEDVKSKTGSHKPEETRTRRGPPKMSDRDQPSAIQTHVVEKAMPQADIAAHSGLTESVADIPQQRQPTPKMSKFKAMRQKRQGSTDKCLH